MKYKFVKIFILLLLTFTLTGCWDYIGVNDITIIAGFAVDKDEKTEKYKLTFEFINLNESSKDKGIKTKIIESSGETVFDAVRNAKKRLVNKLYFGDTKIVIVSNEIAKNDGIESILNWFLKDEEIRETIHFIISQEKTAKEILLSTSVDSPITSYEINQVLKLDNHVTSSTKDVEAYKIYNTLKNPGAALVLPVFRTVKNEKINTAEANGLAAFKNDKLIGYLSASESKYYLFVDDSIDGGLLTLNNDKDKTKDITLEIANSSTSKSYTYHNKKFKITIETETEVYLADYSDQSKPIDEKKTKEIQKKTEKMIEKNINKLIEKSRNEFKTDIFGFGCLIFRSNPKLWKKVEKEWNSIYMDMDIDIKSKVKIVNTAFIK